MYKCVHNELAMISCDVPASRKAWGISSFNLKTHLCDQCKITTAEIQRPIVLPRFGLFFLRFFVGFFIVGNAVIDMTTQVIIENIAPLHIFQIKKDLFKSIQPILRSSKNNRQLFAMVPKWLTSYLANYVITQWSTAFSPISNPSVYEVLYLVKYFGDFKYFISHDI